MVSSKRMTPLMYSSAPSVEKSKLRYARLFSSLDSTPIESKRFLIVPWLSSAARIPLPSATSARAVVSSSVIAHLLLALSIPQQRLYPRHFLRSRGHDPAGADPPRGMDLDPVVSGVPGARPDHGDVGTRVGDGHDCSVLRDHLDDEPLAVGAAQVDVDVAVELFELHVRDDAGRDGAALLHLEPLRVVHARERRPAAAVRRRRRCRAGPNNEKQNRKGDDHREQKQLEPRHGWSVPVYASPKRPFFVTCNARSGPGRRPAAGAPRGFETRLRLVAADPDYEAVVDQHGVVRPPDRVGSAVQVEGSDPERGACRTACEPLTGGRVVDRDRGERVVVAERVVACDDRVAGQEREVDEAVHAGEGVPLSVCPLSDATKNGIACETL